jgi:glutathione S-transferase
VLTVYHVPGTRSMRPVWLCHELDVPVDVVTIDASRAFRESAEWRAISPAGKIPALRDGDLVMFESGAMTDLILARYGLGRLRPAVGTDDWARHQQWCWFAEATLSRPLGIVAALRHAEGDASGLGDDVRRKLGTSLDALEGALDGGPFLLGEAFTAADVMTGYTLHLLDGASLLGAHPRCADYLGRLRARPAFERTLAA